MLMIIFAFGFHFSPTHVSIIQKMFQTKSNQNQKITWWEFLTGGIFREDQKDGSAELAFKYAVYRLNRERTILPNTTLV
jgi:hypothetical protein